MASVNRRQRAFVRDAAVATLVLAVLYGLLRVPFAPLQIPGYLLVVGFDLLEVAFGSAGGAYEVLFAAYLVGLGLVGAGIAGVLRARSDGSPWRFATAGAFALVGSFSLLFGLAVLVGTGQWEPMAITGVAGLVMLALAGWLAGWAPPISH